MVNPTTDLQQVERKESAKREQLATLLRELLLTLDGPRDVDDLPTA